MVITVDYKFNRIVIGNSSFPDQFKTITKRYKIVVYNIYSIQESVYLVVNPKYKCLEYDHECNKHKPHNKPCHSEEEAQNAYSRTTARTQLK